MRVDRLAATGLGAAIVASTLFATLAWNVETRTPLVDIDANVTSWLVLHRQPVLTEAMLGISTVHSLAAIGAWSAIVGLWLARIRERYWLLTLALAVGGAMLVNMILKGIFERARPHMDDPLVLLETFSFPSGHTAASTAFYGVLAAYFVYKVDSARARAAVIAGAIAMVALVAFSRVYLGAHYLSDVLAAACSSTVWLIICLVGVHGLVRKRLEGR